MRANSLAGGIGFAALAALGLVPFMLLGAQVVGSSRALVLYAFGSIVAHVALAAPSLGRGLRAALVTGLLLVPVAWLTPSLSGRLLGGAFVLAVMRSGVLYRTRPGRALAVEALLIVTGLGLARLTGGPTPLGLAVGLWSFYLVQSLYHVVGGIRPRASEKRRDAFAEARERALALMEEPMA